MVYHLLKERVRNLEQSGARSFELFSTKKTDGSRRNEDRDEKTRGKYYYCYYVERIAQCSDGIE